MTRISGYLLCAALGLGVGSAPAETEDGLYGAAVPQDAVFLRRIGSDGAETVIFGRSFTADELPENTYVAISAVLLDGAVAGGHYTILPADTAPAVLQEPQRPDQSKVYLFLLNGDDAPARLSVADGGPVVIEDTAPGQITERAVNPLAVTLTVEGDGFSQDFDVVLRRGVNLTFVVADGAASLIENRFGPVIEAN